MGPGHRRDAAAETGDGGKYTGSVFSGGGVQGGNAGLSAGAAVYPYMVESGTSDIRLVWVPGDGGNQC
jgi:hypothetical protein